jgi:hypothetical protein
VVSRGAWCVGIAVLLVASGGCEKRRSAVIVQHPQWEYQEYDRLAVLPFVVEADSGAAARNVAVQAESYLVDLLADNRTFTVSTRSDFQHVLSEQDLSRLGGVADPSTALPEGMIQVAQAIIVGRITEFDLKRDQRERTIPVIRLDRRGIPRKVGEKRIVEHIHTARLGGNVRVIDAATNRLLMSHSLPAIENEAVEANRPPEMTPEDLAMILSRELATEFFRKLAPQRVEIKLDEDCLVVAAAYFEGEYDELDKVPPDLPEILLVARELPPECNRNDFRLAISPKDEMRYVVTHEFTWGRHVGPRGVVVRVPLTELQATGAREFTAKLFSIGNERPMLEQDFELEGREE